MLHRHNGKRKEMRRLVRQVAWLNVGDECARIPCMLWDTSEGGARLTTHRIWDLPDNFFMLLAGGTVVRACEVRWRDEQFAGVQFL